MQLVATKQRRLKWWQNVLLTIVVTALGRLSGRRSKKSERNLYNKELKQAPWAAPAWLFGPAWSFNNFFLLLALQRLLQETGSHRKKLLSLQIFIWIIFFSFNYIYFKRKSTILTALWSIADVTLAAISFAIALRRNKLLAWHYLPLLTWTSYASTLAGYQVLKNRDVLLRTPPLLHN